MENIDATMNSLVADYYRTKVKDYLTEYFKNDEFKKMVDSGNFVFVSDHLVINDEKYIEYGVNGSPCLTDYAQKNLYKCCLHVIKSDELSHGRNAHAIYSEPNAIYESLSQCQQLIESLVNARGDFAKLLQTPLFDNNFACGKYRSKAERAFYEISSQIEELDQLFRDATQSAERFLAILCSSNEGDSGDSGKSIPRTYHLNSDVFEHSEELKKLRHNLEESISYIEETRGKFSQLAWAQIKRCHCDYKETFREKTLLSDKTFDRIKSGKLNNPDIETVMAICVGLNLGALYGEPLLRSAGYDLEASSIPLHGVYRVLLCTYHNRSIFEWNEVLEALRLPPIRAKAYREIKE